MGNDFSRHNQFRDNFTHLLLTAQDFTETTKLLTSGYSNLVGFCDPSAPIKDEGHTDLYKLQQSTPSALHQRDSFKMFLPLLAAISREVPLSLIINILQHGAPVNSYAWHLSVTMGKQAMSNEVKNINKSKFIIPQLTTTTFSQPWKLLPNSTTANTSLISLAVPTGQSMNNKSKTNQLIQWFGVHKPLMEKLATTFYKDLLTVNPFVSAFSKFPRQRTIITHFTQFELDYGAIYSTHLLQHTQSKQAQTRQQYNNHLLALFLASGVDLWQTPLLPDNNVLDLLPLPTYPKGKKTALRPPSAPGVSFSDMRPSSSDSSKDSKDGKDGKDLQSIAGINATLGQQTINTYSTIIHIPSSKPRNDPDNADINDNSEDNSPQHQPHYQFLTTFSESNLFLCQLYKDYNLCENNTFVDVVSGLLRHQNPHFIDTLFNGNKTVPSSKFSKHNRVLSRNDWAKSLSFTAASRVDHILWYILDNIHPDPFGEGQITPFDELLHNHSHLKSTPYFRSAVHAPTELSVFEQNVTFIVNNATLDYTMLNHNGCTLLHAAILRQWPPYLILLLYKRSQDYYANLLIQEGPAFFPFSLSTLPRSTTHNNNNSPSPTPLSNPSSPPSQSNPQLAPSQRQQQNLNHRQYHIVNHQDHFGRTPLMLLLSSPIFIHRYRGIILEMLHEPLLDSTLVDFNINYQNWVTLQVYQDEAYFEAQRRLVIDDPYFDPDGKLLKSAFTPHVFELIFDDLSHRWHEEAEAQLLYEGILRLEGKKTEKGGINKSHKKAPIPAFLKASNFSFHLLPIPRHIALPTASQQILQHNVQQTINSKDQPLQPPATTADPNLTPQIIKLKSTWTAVASGSTVEEQVSFIRMTSRNSNSRRHHFGPDIYIPEECNSKDTKKNNNNNNDNNNSPSIESSTSALQLTIKPAAGPLITSVSASAISTPRSAVSIRSAQSTTLKPVTVDLSKLPQITQKLNTKQLPSTPSDSTRPVPFSAQLDIDSEDEEDDGHEVSTPLSSQRNRTPTEDFMSPSTLTQNPDFFTNKTAQEQFLLNNPQHARPSRDKASSRGLTGNTEDSDMYPRVSSLSSYKFPPSEIVPPPPSSDDETLSQHSFSLPPHLAHMTSINVLSTEEDIDMLRESIGPPPTSPLPPIPQDLLLNLHKINSQLEPVFPPLLHQHGDVDDIMELTHASSFSANSGFFSTNPTTVQSPGNMSAVSQSQSQSSQFTPIVPRSTNPRSNSSLPAPADSPSGDQSTNQSEPNFEQTWIENVEDTFRDVLTTRDQVTSHLQLNMAFSLSHNNSRLDHFSLQRQTPSKLSTTSAHFLEPPSPTSPTTSPTSPIMTITIPETPPTKPMTRKQFRNSLTAQNRPGIHFNPNHGAFVEMLDSPSSVSTAASSFSTGTIGTMVSPRQQQQPTQPQPIDQVLESPRAVFDRGHSIRLAPLTPISKQNLPQNCAQGDGNAPVNQNKKTSSSSSRSISMSASASHSPTTSPALLPSPKGPILSQFQLSTNLPIIEQSPIQTPSALQLHKRVDPNNDGNHDDLFTHAAAGYNGHTFFNQQRVTLFQNRSDSDTNSNSTASNSGLPAQPQSDALILDSQDNNNGNNGEHFEPFPPTHTGSDSISHQNTNTSSNLVSASDSLQSLPQSQQSQLSQPAVPRRPQRPLGSSLLGSTSFLESLPNSASNLHELPQTSGLPQIIDCSPSPSSKSFTDRQRQHRPSISQKRESIELHNQLSPQHEHQDLFDYLDLYIPKVIAYARQNLAALNNQTIFHYFFRANIDFILNPALNHHKLRKNDGPQGDYFAEQTAYAGQRRVDLFAQGIIDHDILIALQKLFLRTYSTINGHHPSAASGTSTAAPNPVFRKQFPAQIYDNTNINTPANTPGISPFNKLKDYYGYSIEEYWLLFFGSQISMPNFDA